MPSRMKNTASCATLQSEEAALSRRHVLWAAGAAGVAWRPARGVAQPADEVLHVGGSAAFGSISEAVAAASDGATISVSPGMYSERLLLDSRVSIVAEPGATVSWSTSRPYEYAIEARGTRGARISGLRIRHRSPSVANNYAVFLQGSDLVLEDCDISSSTGSGVGIEGGSPAIRKCAVHNCERNGIAVFSELGGAAGGGTLAGNKVSGNKLDGLLIRDGADPEVLDNDASQNGGYGATLKGCAGTYFRNSFAGNGKGSVLVDALADLDTDSLASSNKLDRPAVLL